MSCGAGNDLLREYGAIGGCDEFTYVEAIEDVIKTTLEDIQQRLAGMWSGLFDVAKMYLAEFLKIDIDRYSMV